MPPLTIGGPGPPFFLTALGAGRPVRILSLSGVFQAARIAEAQLTSWVARRGDAREKRDEKRKGKRERKYQAEPKSTIPLPSPLVPHSKVRHLHPTHLLLLHSIFNTPEDIMYDFVEISVVLVISYPEEMPMRTSNFLGLVPLVGLVAGPPGYFDNSVVQLLAGGFESGVEERVGEQEKEWELIDVQHLR